MSDWHDPVQKSCDAFSVSACRVCLSPWARRQSRFQSSEHSGFSLQADDSQALKMLTLKGELFNQFTSRDVAQAE
jgi:hypothetical protein